MTRYSKHSLGAALPVLLLALTAAGGAAAGPIVGCVESETYPIKVCYDDEANVDLADEILGTTETTWAIIVVQLGFTVPWRLDDAGNPEQGAEVVLTDLGEEIAGYAEPLADVPGTSNSDCAARLNINTNLGHYARMVVSHELGLMVQMADDCVESIHEALPTYLSILVVKYSGGFPVESYLQWVGDMFFSAFQSHPFEALDYENYLSTDLAEYAYGHSIFDMYLDERWGGGTGDIMADISFASRQDGTVVVSDGTASLASGENEPDLYDAVDAVLQPLGGSFWDAVKEFSIWRLFTGDLADGGHLQYAASIPGITFDTQFQMSELPLTGRSPANAPAETGTTYINVAVDPSLVTSEEDMLVFELDSIESQNWYIAAVVFNRDGTSRVVDATADGGEGHVGIAGLSAVSSVVFAATNLGDLVHDPDTPEYVGNNFNYSLGFYNKPAITGVSPQQATQGDQGSVVTISGTGFQSGVLVDFGEGVTATGTVVAVSGNSIDATLDVAGDAPVGWHALRVYYKNGPEAGLEQGLEILSGQGPEIAALTPDSGAPGERLNVEIAGQRFRSGMTVAFDGGGITVLRVDFIDAGTVIAQIDIDQAAEPGPRSVTATNPDSKTGTLENGFTVESGGEEAEPGGGGEGCGCQVPARDDGPGGLPAALMVLMALFILTVAGARGTIKMKRAHWSILLGLCLSGMLLAAGSVYCDGGDDVEKKVERIYQLLFPEEGTKAPSPAGIYGCATMNRIEAFRIWSTLPKERKKDLDPLFAPPVPMGCLESTLYPIRSCYNSEDEITKAEAILGYAETSWHILVEQVGFWTPKKGDPSAPETGVDFYLGDTISQGAEAYTAPDSYDVTADHNSCLSYIVINERMNPTDYYVTVVGHEFDHSCQVSMDCTETFNSMESTAVWTEPILYHGSYQYFSYLVPEFQGYPERSVGYWNYNDAYMYGAALFIVYVQEFLGGNDPTSIAHLWEGTVQAGMNNEPDLLDAIVALAEGQSKDFNTVFTTFGEWRYFIASHDDGNHFEHGGSWRGTEVAENGTLSLSSTGRLPVSIGKDLEPLGYLFEPIDITASAFPPGRLRISGEGVVASTWDMELWLMNEGTVDRKIAVLSDEAGHAEIVVESTDLFAADGLMFMALNLGQNVDWDQSWRDQHFTATFDYLMYPEIASVTPRVLYLGREMEIAITGDHFAPGLEVQIGGEGVEILDTTVDSGQQVTCRVSIAQDAPTGPRDVTIVNYQDYEGMDAVLPDGVEIAPPPVPEATALDPDHGAPGDSPIVRMDGSNLTAGVQASLSCPEIAVTQTRFVSAETMYLYLSIPADAQERSCDLTVTDEFDHSSTLPGAFTITSAEFHPEQDANEEISGEIQIAGGSCGCSMIR